MKNIYNFLLPLTMLFVTGIISSATAQIDTRKELQTFHVSKTTSVEVTNQFGNITVVNWDKDSVKFEVEMRVKNASNSRAMAQLNRMSIDFNNNTTLVSATTNFNSEGSNVHRSLNKVADYTRNLVQNDLQVHYTLFLPKHSPLHLNNEFGNIIMPNHAATLFINSSYGDVKLGNTNEYLTLNMKYGNLTAENLDRGSINASYCQLVIGQIINVDFVTKGSKINIQKAERLRCKSRRDDYIIYQLEQINIDGYFTNLIITELKKSMNFSGKYGNLTVHTIHPDFSTLYLNCENTSINFHFKSEASFVVDVHLEKGSFNFPSTINTITENALSDEKATFYGSIGKQAKPNSRLEIFGVRTDVYLSLR